MTMRLMTCWLAALGLVLGGCDGDDDGGGTDAGVDAGDGGVDAGDGGDPDGGDPDGGESDGGDAAVTVTDMTIAAAVVPEASEDLEASLSALTLAAVATSTLETDEVLSFVGELPIGGDKLSDCATKNVTEGKVEIDYTPCDHAEGLVSVDRIDTGTWLVALTADFTIWNVDLDGYLLLQRNGIGDYDLSTCDDAGNEAGVEAVTLTWTGRSSDYEREIVLDGNVDFGPLLQNMELSGEGLLRDAATGREHLLGFGGAPGMAPTSPLEYPRPLDGRCANGGVAVLDGLVGTPLEVTLSFTVLEQIFSLEVSFDLIDIDTALTFNLSDGLIGSVGIVTTGPVIFPDGPILERLAAAGFDGPVHDAISDIVTEGVVPYNPLIPIDMAVAAVTETMIQDAAFCQ